MTYLSNKIMEQLRTTYNCITKMQPCHDKDILIVTFVSMAESLKAGKTDERKLKTEVKHYEDLSAKISRL